MRCTTNEHLLNMVLRLVRTKVQGILLSIAGQYLDKIESPDGDDKEQQCHDWLLEPFAFAEAWASLASPVISSMLVITENGRT